MDLTNQMTVILAAAGSSSRFGRNKLLETLGGKTVIARSVETFLARADVMSVIVAAADREAIRGGLGKLADDPRLRIVPGGACRAESVRAGLSVAPAALAAAFSASAAAFPAPGWVAIHDAARPLVDDELIDRVFQAAQIHGAAAPALAVALTIKQATGPLPAIVERTLPRANLWALQTPQILRRTDLLHAYETCLIPLDQITDDLQLLELQGTQTWLVAGSERNLKLTTALDLQLAENLLKESELRGEPNV